MQNCSVVLHILYTTYANHDFWEIHSTPAKASRPPITVDTVPGYAAKSLEFLSVSCDSGKLPARRSLDICTPFTVETFCITYTQVT